MWLRISYKTSLMFWGNIKACSNVLLCLGTRRVLDLKTINQILFRTLSMSLAFPGESAVAPWFQVGRSSNFLRGNVITSGLSKGHRAGGWQDSGVLCDTGSLSKER